MNKNIKRKIYALALASVMVLLPKTKAYANEIDMGNSIDIDKAISELVPDDVPTPTTKPTEPTEPKKDDNKKNETPSKTEEIINDNNTSTKENNSTNNVTQSNCNHTYSDVADDVINQVTPSCTKGGSYDEVYYCTSCGAKKIVHYEISAPGHKWGSEHKENETESGYYVVRECTNKGCKEIEKVYVPKTPTEPTVPPTTPEKQDVPKTGDDSHVELAAAIMGLSAIGIPITLYELQKELAKEDKKNYKGKYLSKK